MVLAAVLAVVVAAPARASAGPFSGTAEASAVRVSIHDPQIVPFLAGGGLDVTSPEAQATNDSLDNGQAVSSLIYPGQDIAGLTQILGLFLPPSAPQFALPEYPVTVAADQSTPNPADQTGGGYTLSAAVSAKGAATAATTGGLGAVSVPAVTVQSTSTVTPTSNGGITSQARAIAGGAMFGGLLDLGTVSSTATATRLPDGTLKRSSDLSITGASLAGFPIEIQNGSLVVPLLGRVVSLSKAINTLGTAAFKSLGVSVAVQKPQNIKSGIVGPGLRLTFVKRTSTIPLPSVPLPTLIPEQPVIGTLPPSTLTVVVTLGYSDAEATLGVAPSTSIGHGGGGHQGTVGTKGGSPATDSGASSPTSANSGSIPNSGGGFTPPSGSTGLGATPVVASTPGTSSGATQILAYRLGPRVDGAGIYLLIVLAALLVVGVGQIMRYQGVRTRRRS